MYRFIWLLIPMAAFCHPPRYARLGESDGKADVQIQAADAWQPAVRNTPLPQSARVMTAAGSHAEIELDEGSVVRLAPESLLELSDYTRLSSGQRLTLLSLDRGMAYFTGQAGKQDALMLAVPGAQITVQRGTRLRIEAGDLWSQIAVIEGKVRFSSPSAEMDLTEGEMARVDPANRAKFYLYREIAAYESDRWSEARDKALASVTSSTHVPELHYGAQDLDAAGAWIDTETFGTVWKPKTIDGWAPYRDGRWAWYDDLGYTWIANDAWGWLPYHYGRWSRTSDLGWFWTPGKSTVFKPGDVYWLRGAKVAGWGPLAPAEDWSPSGMPQLYLNSSTTWAEFAPDTRVIDPAGFTSRPKEPLAVASFALALPSPAFLASRLEATRPPLRTGATRILPVISGVTYEDTGTAAQAPPPPLPPPIAPDSPVSSAPPPPPIILTVPPPNLPVEIYYPVPVYTGVVVINPPDGRGDGNGRRGKTASSSPPPTAPGPPPTSPSSTRTIAKRPPEPRPVEPHPPSTPRGDEGTRDHRAPTAPVPHPEPPHEPTHATTPPRENPRAPVAPVVRPDPAHEPTRVATPPLAAPPNQREIKAAPPDKDK